MAKINEKSNNFYWLYIAGFFIILALPALNVPPWFTPSAYTQAIVFRSLLAVLGFIYLVKEKTLRHGSGQVNFKEVFNPHTKTFLPLISLLAYFFAVFISTLFSLDVSRSLWGTPERGAGFINFSFFILFCIFCFSIIKKEDPPTGEASWKKLLDFSLIIGFLVGLIAVLQQFGFFASFLAVTTYRPSSTLGNPIILALYLLPLLFLSLSFFISEANKVKKYSYLFLVIFYSFVIIFITQTRAAILGMLVGLFCFLIFYPARDNVISNGASPKKFKWLKISAVVLPMVFIFFLFFLSANPQIYAGMPNLIKDTVGRTASLTTGAAVDPSRISAWKISISAFFEKPYFGYGPENFYVAFNKHYDPNLPAMEDIKDFDRAHNYLIQILVDSGIFALIFYLVFFLSLLWGLQKIKKKYPVAHGLQAGFIAFFIAGLASIDGAAIMLIFFFLSAYSLHLISLNNADATLITALKNAEPKNSTWWKPIIIVILFLILIIFLWQYNLIPLQMNKQIVIARAESSKNWKDTIKIMDEQSKINTFFLPYANSVYLNLLIDRIIAHPEENSSVSQKVKEISGENTILQPYDYRNWLRLGESLATIAKENKDPEIIKKSDEAFKRAMELSPRDPSILFSFFMADVSFGDLKGAKEKSVYCLKTFPKIRDCLWMSGLINIYLGDVKTGKEFVEKAKEDGYSVENEISLRQLVAAYLETKNYKEMLPLYQKLFVINGSQIQYKTSIMLIYKELGNYNMARQIASEVIKSNPELEDQIDSFLSTLIYAD